MKIAVQLFGHLRTFARCADTLRCHLLDRYPQHDVFLHTWDRLEHQTLTHHTRLGLPAPVDEAVINEITRLYRPTAMTIGAQTARDHGVLSFVGGKQMAISGIAYMLESMQGANRLRERHASTTGTHYDLVVATRPDIALHRALELERFLAYALPPTVPSDETLNTRFAAAGPLPLILNDLRGFPGTDLLFFGRPDVMTRVLAIADHLDRYDLRAIVAPTRPRNVLNTYGAEIGVTTAVVDYLRPRDFDIVRP